MRLHRYPPLSTDLAALLPQKARTFALASRFLPAHQQEPVVVLYAFCRLLDDLVDEPPPSMDRASIAARLEQWRVWLLGSGDGTCPPEPTDLATAIRAVILDHAVPPVYLTQLLDGLKADLEPVQIRDFAALRQYSFLVAGTVGLAMSHLLGGRHPEALAAASDLGIAMQLTNILRDVGADIRGGRCYLPTDELAQLGYSPERLRALVERGRPDDDFRAVMRFQIARARDYYTRGLAGVWLLPPEARPAILIAGRLYRAILNTIEANDYDVLRRRAVVSRLSKGYEALISLALVHLWRHRAMPPLLAPASTPMPLPGSVHVVRTMPRSAVCPEASERIADASL
jgi:phytoene synthase